jgi:hypothetical protein
MKATTFGLDIAKRTFQMYWVEALPRRRRGIAVCRSKGHSITT